jgi:cation:H+ antiporter
MKNNFWVRLFAPFAIALVASTPALTHFFLGWPATALTEALIYGAAIVSAAFVLGWVGEAAEIDLSGGLTVGLLALITILPEYVVSVYFAFAAGTDPEMAKYASANLTGANRLLLGLGWPLMAWFGYLATRKAQPKVAGTSREFGIRLESEARIDLAFLFIASIVALLIPATAQIHLLVGLVLLLLFIGYLWRQSRNEREEPELEGVAALVGGLPKIGRRIFIIVAVLVAAAVILMSAEPFAHGLVQAGRELGIDDYLLIQWLAPIASEAPEFILAAFFALRGRPGVGLAVLLSSKVNQWTILTASLPIGFIVGGGHGAAILLDPRQVEEFVLTAAQTLMGVGLLLGLRLGFRAASALFVLFVSTFIFTGTEARWFIAGIYMAIAIGLFIGQRRHLGPTLKTPFR